jgi:hypothetical protein
VADSPQTNPVLAVRYGLPGSTCILLFALPIGVGVISLRLPSLVPVAAAAFVIGFLLDVSGAYKLHPQYRAVKNCHFRTLALCERPYDTMLSDEEAIRVGEGARERALWTVEPERRNDLRLEHALWVATLHVHILLGGAFVALAIVGSTELLATHDAHRAISGLAIATGYAVLSVVFMRAGFTRLASYNDKILDITRTYTSHARSDATSRALSRLFAPYAPSNRGYEAYQLAAQAHADESRDNGEEYILHPVRVALLLLDDLYVSNEDTLVLALLHDILEAPRNRRPDLAGITEQFGRKIAQDCRLLATKVGSTRQERDDYHAAIVRAATKRVRLVKIADRIDNVRALATNPDPRKVARYSCETERNYVSISCTIGDRAERLLGESIAGIARQR